MWAFLLATFIYCFAFAANMRFKCTRYSRLSGHVAFFAGSFSSISLVSVLLPALWIYQRIMTLIFKILGFWYRFLDDMTVEEQPEYPVEIIISN
jgi:hypothetical protein